MIEVFDDRGQHMGDRPFDQRPGGCDLIVNPDPPQINQDLYVRVEYPDPSPVTPKVFFEFMSMGQREYVFPEGPGQRVYEITIAGSEIIDDIRRLGVGEHQGMIECGRDFITSDQERACNISLSPNPAVVGEALLIRAEFDEPVTTVPRAYIYFGNDVDKNYAFSEGPGLTTYELTVPAQDVVYQSGMVAIKEYDSGPHLCEFHFGQPPRSEQECSLYINPHPPQINQDLYVKADFPQDVDYNLRVFIKFRDTEKEYTLPK